jgi:hypothetical protein
VASLRDNIYQLVIARLFSAPMLVLTTCSVFAQSPALNHVLPSAVAPGKTTTLTLVGENLNGATELWTSFPAKVTRAATTNANESGKVVFQVVVPKNVPVGIEAVRLATTNGVSNLVLLMIDDLPDAAGHGTNKTIATAQELKWPVAVDGQCDELCFDYYRLAAKRGQRVSVEVVANRLGSPLDPVVRLLDAAGKELAYCDDDPGLGSDPRFGFTIPASGQYLLEVRDVAYQGGQKHRYRLRLGDFPLISVPFPPGIEQGKQATVSFLGRDLRGLRNRSIEVPSGCSESETNVSVRFSRGKGSSFVTLHCSDLPELSEAEPNDRADQATKVATPSAINGRFEKSRDRDCFEFHATKDEWLIFSGRTRSLGSPCDLSLRLLNSDGTQIAEADVVGANEGALTNTFKDAGTFCLLLEELNRQGGPDLAYRVEIRHFEPGFTLSVETERIVASPGGTFEVKVTAARRRYDGPITLSPEDLGNDVVLENNVIAEKKNDTTLKVKLPERFLPGQMARFRIQGKAKIDENEFSAPVSTMPALRKLFPLLRYPPAKLDGLIALGIRSPAARVEEEKPEKTE